MKKNLLIYLLIICSGTIVKSQSNIWNDIQESQIQQKFNRIIIPDAYRVLEFDLNNINNILDTAPDEFTIEAAQNPSIVLLPMPDGRIERFTLYSSPTMIPEPQSQYPEIRTFTLQSINDKAASFKMDLILHGFNAMILSPNGIVFIDSYDRGNSKDYIFYYIKNFIRSNTSLDC